MRSVSRLADVFINTVLKLLVDAGKACATFHDDTVRDVIRARRVRRDLKLHRGEAEEHRCDENPRGRGRRHLDMDGARRDTKLIVSHFVGGRDGDCAMMFMDDVAKRLANRVQFTTDDTGPISTPWRAPSAVT